MSDLRLSQPPQHQKLASLSPTSDLTAKELTAKRLEFCTTRLAEFAEKVDRSVNRHFPQLKEGFVRHQIGIDDPSCAQFGTFDDRWRGQDAHPANLYVKLDQCWYVRLVVLERVDIAFEAASMNSL
jgi:hypothetical protein